MLQTKSKLTFAFNAQKYLETAGVRKKIVSYHKGEIIFSQGNPAASVLYILEGRVKISVLTSAGKEAVIALMEKGEFFGEGCISGQPLRVSTATGFEPATIIEIQKGEMIRVLHEEHEFSDFFVAYMLKRNVRVEEDLVDQLFNSSEKRLARALLLIARYGKEESPEKIIPKITQETLAEMIGTTRTRVSYFMNKFKKQGYIQYKGGLHVNSSLLRVIVHE